jgi:hypothetical protein
MSSSFRDTDNVDLCLDDVMYTTVKSEIPPPPDHQATESRLRSLEAELNRMRKTLSQSLVDSAQRRQAAAASSSASGPETLTLTPKGWNPNPSVPMASHSGRPATPCKMATVHEGAVAAGNSCGGGSGCISQLNPVNGTTGLLAKTLQKLKLRAFGKATKSVVSSPGPRLPARQPPRFESDTKSCLVARTDSMPRPATRAQAKPRHARRNSMS